LFLLPTFIYFLFHLLPDILGRGKYSDSASAPSHPPRGLPHLFPKALLFVWGWAFVVFGVVLSIAETSITQLLIETFGRAVSDWESVGKLEKGMSGTIQQFVVVARIGLWVAMVATILCAVGGVFLFVSQRLRWKKFEHDLDIT
jgi:hypothetical protein